MITCVNYMINCIVFKLLFNHGSTIQVQNWHSVVLWHNIHGRETTMNWIDLWQFIKLLTWYIISNLYAPISMNTKIFLSMVCIGLNVRISNHSIHATVRFPSKYNSNSPAKTCISTICNVKIISEKVLPETSWQVVKSETIGIDRCIA